MSNAPSTPSAKTSPAPPPHALPPGYAFIEWVACGEFESKLLEVLDPGQAPAAISVVPMDQKRPEGVEEFRSLKVSLEIGGHPNVLKYRRAWLLTEDGKFIDALHQTAWPRSGWEQTSLFIEMELAKGSLATRLNECRQQQLPGIPAAELLPLLLQAARGIDHLCDEGVVPQDVNPANLLIVGGEVKVANYGRIPDEERLGKLTDPKPFSTANYAPQGWSTRRIPRRFDTLYSLAVSGYHLLSGSLPFRSATPGWVPPQDAREAHDSRQLDFRSVSKEMEAVLLQAIDKQPPFLTCVAFVEALTAAWERSAVSAGSGSTRCAHDSTRELPSLGNSPTTAQPTSSATRAQPPSTRQP
ncbi:MAG TPA: hypothetical protein VKE74_00670, partial [Gemmataceae bacterium]|nr:hypothetical protein [Gemmataceae bacterium]